MKRIPIASTWNFVEFSRRRKGDESEKSGGGFFAFFTAPSSFRLLHILPYTEKDVVDVSKVFLWQCEKKRGKKLKVNFKPCPFKQFMALECCYVNKREKF